MYQPELGRFLQPDPKHFEAGDYNLYRYCRNDPINKSDPTGLETLTRPEIDDQVGDRVVQIAQFIAREIAGAYRDPVGFIVTAATMGRGADLHIPGRLKLPTEKISARPAKPGKAPTGDEWSSRRNPP